MGYLKTRMYELVELEYPGFHARVQETSCHYLRYMAKRLRETDVMKNRLVMARRFIVTEEQRKRAGNTNAG